jgi:hypothetical protein
VRGCRRGAGAAGADDLLVVRRLADHRDPGVLQLGGEGGDGAGGVALVAQALGDVGGVLPALGGGDEGLDGVGVVVELGQVGGVVEGEEVPPLGGLGRDL